MGKARRRYCRLVLSGWVLAAGPWLCPIEGSESGEDQPVYELKPYAVSAWHFGMERLDVPGDVTRIGEAVLEEAAAGNLVELLEEAANLDFRSVTGRGNAGEVSMRGFGENSGLRVLVLVDGLKANRPDMGNIEWQQLPLGEIESIEVIRGGQNVLYGNHAVAGVIDIRTRKGGTRRLHLEGGYGTEGKERLSASLRGTEGAFYYRLAGVRERDRGTRENSLSWSRFGQGTIGYAATARDDLSLRISGSREHLQFPGPLTYEQYLEDPGASFNSGREFSNSRGRRITGRWEGVRDWGAFEVYGGRSRRDLDWDLDGTHARNKQSGTSFAPRVRVGKGNRFLLVGGDLFRDTLDFFDYLEPEHEILQARADLERLTSGAYLFGQQPLAESLFLSAGIRYERAETDFLYEKFDPGQINPLDPVIWDPERPNPNFKDPPDIVEEASIDETLTREGWASEFSLNWRPVKRWRFWAGYDRVYRYPVLDEVAAYQGFPLSDPLNRDLEPEEGNSFEVGGTYRAGALEISGTLYDLRMENEIAFDEEVNLNTNIGRTRRTGAEVALAQAGERAGWSLRWALIEAELREGANRGETVPLVAEHHGVVTGWIAPVEPLRLYLSYAYTGERFQGGDYGNEERKLPAHGILNARLSWDWEEGRGVVLRVRNLFDKAYLSTAFNGGYYPGEGRRYELSLRIRL